MNVDLAQKVVHIDEIDKIARKAKIHQSQEMYQEGVQQALLKMLEGTIAMCPTGGKHHTNCIQIDTVRFYLCGGAFIGLEDIVQKRLGKHSIGFTTNSEESKVDSKK